MDKYKFVQYSSSEYKVDPVFKSNRFDLFGNPGGVDDDPDLFEVYDVKFRRFAYCLTEPRKIIRNNEMLLKIRRYLYAHEYNDNLDDFTNTYFIGDMQKSIDISNEFSNQNIILVTYSMIEQWYPKCLEEIFQIIINDVLKRQKYLGQMSFFNSLNDDILFVDPKLNDSEKTRYKQYLQKCMEDEGLISIIKDGIHVDCFVLTTKAISKVRDSKQDTNKVAFIAIKFDENEDRINAIQDAISSAGFEPIIMNKLETNNWIMPEIFYQIKNSKFVVVDFSIPCDGAYYEAGYAAALDKPVIHLFDNREKTDINKLHFDIAQKSTIFYDDFEDLRQRLKNRIIATIKDK